jgi:hypothetical protein
MIMITEVPYNTKIMITEVPSNETRYIKFHQPQLKHTEINTEINSDAQN